jgi:hypothetical protein
MKFDEQSEIVLRGCEKRYAQRPVIAFELLLISMFDPSLCPVQVRDSNADPKHLGSSLAQRTRGNPRPVRFERKDIGWAYRNAVTAGGYPRNMNRHSAVESHPCELVTISIGVGRQ